MNAYRRGIRTVCAAVLLLLVFVAQLEAAYVEESFAGSSVSDWTFLTAAGEGPSLTAAEGIDPEGDGWLRLTEDYYNQNSFVYYNNPIQTSRGLVFSFDFVIWSATSSNADGFALVIFDAEATPVSAGGWGGSLGYAQHTSNGGTGLNGGIAGFGFDTFGNFSNPTEGRIGGPGKRPDSIAIRGSMGADRTQGYAYVTGVEDLPDFETVNAASRDDAVIHSVRLTITPEKLVSIEWKTEGGEWETLLDCFQCTLNCPPQIKFGFTASTGAVYSNQEIRNVTLEPYLDTDEPPAIGDGPFVAAGAWPALSRYRSTAFELEQNYNVLWTYSDDYGSCEEAAVNTAAYRLDGTTTWRWLRVQDEGSGYAWTELPVDVMQDGTYQFYTSVQDCAGQRSHRTVYYKVESGNIAPADESPSLISGPFLAAGTWPRLATTAAGAFEVSEDFQALWTFSDDYATCSGLCHHIARYRNAADAGWDWIGLSPVSTDQEGTQYAYVTIPIETDALATGTYMFETVTWDCLQQTTWSRIYYFKVAQ